MSDFFNGKKVLVAGVGVSGTGAKEALLELNVPVCTYCDGEPFKSDDYGAIILSPSFEKTHFLYAFAKERNVPIMSEYELGCALNEKPLIAVTGTNGKTTVVGMIDSIFTLSQKTALCGNVGVSFASLAVNGNYDVAITEVSSFQLEQTSYMHPHVAVITNITPDHLIRHKTMEEYSKIKYSITAHQNSDDWLVLPYESELYGLAQLSTRAKVAYVSTHKKTDGAYIKDGAVYFYGEHITALPNREYLSIPHNVENALFAVAVSKIFGISNEDIKLGLERFAPRDHRIQLVNVINGVRFYNDSKSTNVDSTLKALLSMKGSVALILGGSEKGLDYADLFKKLTNVIRICVIGEIADSLIVTAKEYGFSEIYKCEDIEKATVCAYLVSPDNVLLSPGSASYDMFASYKQRGEKFIQAVMRIANGKL